MGMRSREVSEGVGPAGVCQGFAWFIVTDDSVSRASARVRALQFSARIESKFAWLKRTAVVQLTQSIVAHQLADDLGMQRVFAGFEGVAGAHGG